MSVKMLDGHVLAYVATTGSHFRNLHNEGSDVDKKAYVMPRFSELYYNKSHKNFTTSDEVDIEVHDVRKLESLLFGANLTYLDTIFAYDIEMPNPEFAELLEIRDDIARMNLSSLYSCCMGMFDRQFKDMTKRTSEMTGAIIDKYGYNPKKAMMCYHFAKFLINFHANGYSDYRKANWYEDDARSFMLWIKSGEMSHEQVVQVLRQVEAEAKELQTEYKSHSVNEETLEQVKSILKRMVKNHIRKELAK